MNEWETCIDEWAERLRVSQQETADAQATIADLQGQLQAVDQQVRTAKDDCLRMTDLCKEVLLRAHFFMQYREQRQLEELEHACGNLNKPLQGMSVIAEEVITNRDALQQRVAQLEGERDEVSKKYHEAMGIMSAWKNIDHAEAVARLLTLQADHATLLGLVQATTKLLTELTIIPIGCSREQELAWKKAVKDLRAASLPAQPAQGGA